MMDGRGCKDDFAILCGGGRLTVTWSSDSARANRRAQHKRDSHEFTRTFTLPETAEVQSIWAEVNDNVLAFTSPSVCRPGTSRTVK